MENSILKLHNKALVSAENYKKAEIALIDVLIELDAKRAYYQFDCNSLFEYCTKLLKLSESSSYKFIRIARVSKKIPELKKSLERGEITSSKAVSLCSVLNTLKPSSSKHQVFGGQSLGREFSSDKILGRGLVENEASGSQVITNRYCETHTAKTQGIEGQSTVAQTKQSQTTGAQANQTQNTQAQVGEVLTAENQASENRSLNEWLEIAKKSTSRQLEAEIIIARPKDFSLVESKRTLSKEISSLHLKLPKDIMGKLDRAQDLLSKQGRTEASYTEVLDQLLDFYLKRKDPLKKVRKSKVSQNNKVPQSKQPLKNQGRKANLEEDPQNRVLAKTGLDDLLSSKARGKSKLEVHPQNIVFAKTNLEIHLQNKVCMKTNVEEDLQTRECWKSNPENHLLNKACAKTNLEEDLQKRVVAKTKPGDSLQKKSSSEMSLQKLRKYPSKKKSEKTRIKNSLQKQVLQKKSPQKMGEETPKRAGATKTVLVKPKLRRAIPQKIKTQVFQKYKSCAYRKVDGSRCNQTRYLEIHHKVPVANGGSDSPSNLVLLCASCHKLHHQKETHSKTSDSNAKIRKKGPVERKGVRKNN